MVAFSYGKPVSTFPENALRLTTKGGVGEGPCEPAGAILTVPDSADDTFLEKGN